MLPIDTVALAGLTLMPGQPLGVDRNALSSAAGRSAGVGQVAAGAHTGNARVVFWIRGSAAGR